MAEHRPRRVSLRAEEDGRDSRYLSAWIDEEGGLRIDGQDLGPGTAIRTDKGEYEWFQTIKPEHLPRLRELLGADPDEDLLDHLKASWSGRRSYDLERLLREHKDEIPSNLFVWS